MNAVKHILKKAVSDPKHVILAGVLCLIFLSGLFALLTVAGGDADAREHLLDHYVQTIVHGMEPR